MKRLYNSILSIRAELNKVHGKVTLGNLHDDVILLQRPESFRVLLSCANYGFCHLNLAGIRKFEYERKNEKDSGRSSKTTPSCKWHIAIKLLRFMLPLSQNTIPKKN